MHLDSIDDVKFQQLILSHVIKRDILLGQSSYKEIYDDIETKLISFNENKQFLNLYYIYLIALNKSIQIEIESAKSLGLDDKKKALVRILYLELEIERVSIDV